LTLISVGETTNWGFAGSANCIDHQDVTQKTTTWSKISTYTENNIEYFKLQLKEVGNNPIFDPNYFCFTSSTQATKMGFTTRCDQNSVNEFFMDQYNRLNIKMGRRSKHQKCVYLEENDDFEARNIKTKRCAQAVYFNDSGENINQLVASHTNDRVKIILSNKGVLAKVEVGEIDNSAVNAAGAVFSWIYDRQNQQITWNGLNGENFCLNQKKLRSGKFKGKINVVDCDDASKLHIDDGVEGAVDGYEIDQDYEIHAVNEEGVILFNKCLMTVERSKNKTHTKLIVSECRRRLGNFSEFSFKGDPNLL